ncbi:MAG: GIY-YIG nuclease family protein [Patescibacteria group bacterium]
MKTKPWYLYILLCSDNTYYTGIATNLDKRIEMHNSKKGAKYTRGRLPVKLAYSEKLENESLARKREFEIKALTRKKKKELIKK